MIVITYFPGPSPFPGNFMIPKDIHSYIFYLSLYPAEASGHNPKPFLLGFMSHFFQQEEVKEQMVTTPRGVSVSTQGNSQQ